MEWEAAGADDAAEQQAELESAEAQVQRAVWAVAGLFVAASVVASVTLIRGHLRHFSQPIVQSKVRPGSLLTYCVV